MSASAFSVQTTVRCLRCGVRHRARIEREGAQIAGRVQCPQGRLDVLLSSDADLYLALRARSHCLEVAPAGRKRSIVHLLPITDTCNFRCPVCYAGCQPLAEPAHVPLNEVVERAARARANGARAICLTGGEPTLHPDLLDIVRRVGATGAKVFLITNGLRLGTESSLAPALAAAGLGKVDLQFDTLDPEVHRQIRGNTQIQEKIQAAKAVLAAGIRLGTVTTVTRLNLREVGALIAFGLSLGPGVKTMMFQTAAPVGRFELSRALLVDKEQIAAQVLASPALPHPTARELWPFPHVEPWGMRVHPDCGVSLVVFRDRRQTLHLASEWINLPGLNDRLHALGPRTDWWARNFGPLRCLLASIRPGRTLPVLRNLAGFLIGGGNRSALLIAITSFCPAEFIDQMRIDGCATTELRTGEGVSPCVCYLSPASLTVGQRKEDVSAYL